MTNILITGSLGQIGAELVDKFREKYGADHVIATDIKQQPHDTHSQGPYEYLNVLDKDRFTELIVNYEIDWLVHNASVLSATGERNPKLALDVNIRGFENAIELAKQYNLRILSPSSIAAFGPTTPKINTPDFTIMRPTTIYGVSKVYIELLGEYYHQKWDVDFRSLRYPGIISWKSPPGGGTTDYAVEIFHEALKNKQYTSFLDRNTILPMMHIDDCLLGTVQLMEANDAIFTQRTFNLAAVSFSPQELAVEIQKHIPDFEITYEPDYRQEIAKTWPESIDDSEARKQWNWQHQYDLSNLVIDMFHNLSDKLGIPFQSMATH
ncbi:MAG: putative epimerase/dehydratase [Candidatus Heimdallarchaeota archaeon LC_2]|nr:MAG: putative epimerase/dehydratase [Candidatus Heimdallarchaeota archaeon LC_2]